MQVAITMKEPLGQNHARNRLSAKSYRCSILEVGEPGDSARNGITTREILEVEPTLRAWLSYMRCRMANTRLPLVNVGMQIKKKYFWNFNFNFNYRELLSKSATVSLRSFGVVLLIKGIQFARLADIHTLQIIIMQTSPVDA